MRFFDLCAGIGGFSLGLEWAGMTCVGQVEIDPFCNRVLEKHWPHVPRWKNLKNESEYNEYPAVDLVCGGYPCQPFSAAGKRRGEEDDRHLWPYVFKIVQRLQPAWCLFENVAGHISLGLDTVLSDLENAGYACRAIVIPACAVGAPHRRDRVWIIANAAGRFVYRGSGEILRESARGAAGAGREGIRQENRAHGTDLTSTSNKTVPNTDGNGLSGAKELWESNGCAAGVRQDVPDADRAGLQECNVATITAGARLDSRVSLAGESKPGISGSAQFRMGGGVDGIPAWVDEHLFPRLARGIPANRRRLFCLGNAVVPVLVCEIGRAIIRAQG